MGCSFSLLIKYEVSNMVEELLLLLLLLRQKQILTYRVPHARNLCR